MARERIELPDPILFERGKVNVDAAGLVVIAKVAERLKANPQVRHVRIEGHAEQSVREAGQSAVTIAQRRAESVRALLVERGIEPERLQAVGFGGKRPVVTSGPSLARNRRVEFVVVDQ